MLSLIESENPLTLGLMISRLSERNLAALYDQCQAPVRLHMALHGAEGITADGQTEIEGIVRFNPPDLALISLGLCAVVLAEHLVRENSEHVAQVTEMKYLGIDCVETFGPVYLGESTGLEDLEALLELCPIHLCALGSIFEELSENVPVCRILSEIAYDQADRAEALLAGEPMDAPQVTAPPPSSNVVPLDLFTAWRTQKEPAE